MSTKNKGLRFPSGMTAEQVGKDAKRLQDQERSLSHKQALDKAAVQHQSPLGYDAGIRMAQEFADYLAEFPNSPNIQYCIKCERPATVLGSMRIPYCGYHADVDCDESEIPPYQGKIPEGSRCFELDCTDEPTKILGGACFCDKHYGEAKSGARYRRNLFGG